MSGRALTPRTRFGLLAIAVSLTVTGGVTAATLSSSGVATVTASSPHRSLSAPDTRLDEGSAATSTTVGAVAIVPTPTTKPRAPSPSTAPSTSSSSAATGTVLEPAEEGVYVLDVSNGQLRKADSRGPFDVVGQTLYVTHGTTVHKMPVGGGSSTPVLTVAGATELEWIEMSPAGYLLTEWMVPAPGGNGGYLYRSHVDPTGHVLNSELGDNKVEWSPDGSYFVVFDYRGVRAIKADGSPMWGPLATPEQFPYDVEFTPDGRDIVVVLNQASYAFNVASKEWKPLALRHSVSMADNGQFATSPVPPAGWSGFTQLGTIVSDLSGNTTKLTATGSEPVLSPTGAHVIYSDEALRRIGDRGAITFRLATRDGKVLYTISHPGWELGRDTMRSGNPVGSWLEGPQWSADGRYVVFGLYNPYV